MRVVYENDFENLDLPLTSVGGRSVQCTVRRLRVVHTPMEGPPSVVLCGGVDGCGLYMPPACVSEDAAGKWPIFVCFACDKALLVRFGKAGEVRDDEEESLS